MTITQAMLEINRINAAIAEASADFVSSNNWNTEVINNEATMKVEDIPLPEENAIALKSFEKLQTLLDQKSSLQRRINASNRKHGLDVLLANRAALKERVAALKRLLPGYGQRGMKLCLRHIPWGTEGGNTWRHSLTGAAVSTDELRAALRALENDLHAVDIEIAAKNNLDLVD